MTYLSTFFTGSGKVQFPATVVWYLLTLPPKINLPLSSAEEGTWAKKDHNLGPGDNFIPNS
jgi:hypothetical protein